MVSAYSLAQPQLAQGRKPRAYSPVNIIGKVLGDATICRKIMDGTPISITRLQE